MKRMNLVAMGVAIAAFSTGALATPQYTGSTTATGELALNQGAGYYIWNDASNTSNWSIRWTGDGAEIDGLSVDWSGSIGFVNESLGTYQEISFENNHNSIGIPDPDQSGTDLSGNSSLEWIAFTNTTGGYDGLDFNITSDYELMEFKLGSNLFNNIGDTILEDPGVPGSMIFIGANYETPNVLINDNGRQQFEIAVPEPGTLALLGLGLAGLGAARRRQKAA